jgi:hypothetical protein
MYMSFSSGSLRWCSIEIPAAATSTRRSTRWGNLIAHSAATNPPIELPTNVAASMPTSSQNASTNRP